MDYEFPHPSDKLQAETEFDDWLGKYDGHDPLEWTCADLREAFLAGAAWASGIRWE